MRLPMFSSTARWSAGGWVCGTLAVALLCPPDRLWAQANNAATQQLLEKAHAMEARSRMDMAAQTWQQVLLADPNNTEALGGLARAAKMSGNNTLANTYLQRLRAINPNDPGIARAEGVMQQSAQLDKLNQAGKLAGAGNYAQAMTIYRQVFPNGPPPGDWSLAYYETESATDEGRPHAVAGLRGLVEKYPQDTRYQVALGRILTYNPRTRAEGRRLLQKHPQDPQAVEALKQSLVWDAQNPAAAADIRAYLQTHKDPALAEALRNTAANEARARKAGAGRVVTPEEAAMTQEERQRGAEEAAAYGALNAKNLEEAEARFKALLVKNSDDAQALAGMGYVRMNQSNFGGAISFLEQAKQDGSKDRGVDTALATSRFWYTMGEGSIALNENDLPTAEKNYRSALQMRPASPEAMEGLAGTLVKAQQPEAAVPVFEQYVRLKPASPAAWRGLFMAQYATGNAALALTTEKRIPSAVRTQLMRDPEFLRTLASAYSAVGRDADAQRILRSALELPFPSGGEGLKVETQLQYASLLQQANRMEQAAGLYRQVLVADPSNVPAWQGLVRVEHAAHSDALAQQTLETMPPTVYDQALRDPGFMTTAASVYQAQNKYDVAQALLEKAVSQQTTAGQKPSSALMTQLAGLYLQRNDAQKAYPIYRQILLEDPSRIDAWKGLLGALHTSGHDREALAQIQQIPVETRKHLEGDVDYLQTVGAVYNGLNQPAQAMVFLNRVQQKYAAAHSQAPADIDIQNAYLLFNGNNDTGLYRQLMVLGSRGDLTDEQRRSVQTIWALWAVRRANQASAQGYVKRPLAILNAAARAFPDNPGVIKALASGYLRAGLPKQATAIFKAQDMTSATASDYKSAVGAAIASGDLKDAETWLRFGLEQYPKDSQMLTLAAKFEQARGDSGRAADYYRASLAAMPPADPGAELADELSRPVAALRPPTVAQQQDLATLLAPGTDAATGPAGVAVVETVPEKPYLPSYGNAYGQAPVVLTPDGTPAGGALVPQYMVNPQYQQRMQQQQLQQQQQTQQPGKPRNTRLGDYVPTAGLEQPSVGAGSTDEVLTASSVMGDPQSLAYQREQIRRLTQQAQDSAFRGQVPGAVIASNAGDVYGPYIPYNSPDNSNPVPMFNAVAAPVQLAGTQSAPVEMYNAATTDVLPSTRNVPNAKGSRKGRSSHPEIAAAEAAEERRRQSDPGSRTLSSSPVSMMGQSSPPEDVDVAPVQQSQYAPNQTGRPAGLPAMETTNGVSGQGYPTQSQYSTTVQRQATDSYGQQYPQPRRGQTATRQLPRRIVRRAPVASSTSPGPAYAPLYYPAVPTALSGQGYPALGAPYPLGTVPTDAQLVQRNLPPLRGAFNPNGTPEVGPPLNERQQAELDLATLEASYSGWAGGSPSVRFRSGTPGMNRLLDFEAPIEATFVAGKTVRFSIIPKAIFLNSGTLDVASFANTTGTIPILGTLPANAVNQPAQQVASGVGGEIQMTAQNLGLAVGYTPYEFLVRNVTGRARWRPGGGHFTLFGERDSVKDTQLSYSGMYDPGSTTTVFAGNIWGGVISTGGGARFDFGDEKAGFYLSFDGAAVTGFHVLDNKKFEGTGGAYFRVAQFPGYGTLNVGGTLFGMHYDHNERGQTYGLGGYFSPDAYFLGAIPITFNGFHGTNWHYVLAGAVGIQTFQEDSAAYYPLDTSLQTGALSGCTLPAIAARTCGYYPVNSGTGANFDISAQASYRVNEHWFVGGFAKANNTNNYNTGTVGFSVHYMFRPQYATEDYPTGLFPVDGLRPLRVP
ncbi:cellulose synthase subunit BcsC-related outer membrane protein [Terriglobus saanensis]|uniref:Cellulose synthase operon C domain protein n=1 Tax=Terriglobus saanensis (strain ATCC BAA-1853 / DSM 23119 / SP1PR4) TaxID=401053 RepID=E8V0S9_TERSS|nr:cellulose synthase subunit BcsC-related outer membrane protein [Terriglobus saanensis]ADV82220.1 cellulose synthase operon C domain protein [Terriglobus saanensis SP1PR4]